MPSVLDGVRVLDLSWGIAGPITGMLLADHGADVIKVEPPGGDPFRGTPGYDVWLRGRRTVVLNLKQAGDRDLPDLEIPDGMEPGSPRRGPIFTYTPWLSMGTAFLADRGAIVVALDHPGIGASRPVGVSFTSAMTTFMPSRPSARTVARPMPLADPVMTATLPASSCMACLSSNAPRAIGDVV
jgi:hypothetical protein